MAQAGMLPGDVVVVCSRMVLLSEFWARCEKDSEMSSQQQQQLQLQQHLVSLCRNGFLVSNKIEH